MPLAALNSPNFRAKGVKACTPAKEAPSLLQKLGCTP